MFRNGMWAMMIGCGLCLTACERKEPSGGEQGAAKTTVPTTQPAGALNQAKQTAQEVADAGEQQLKDLARAIRDRYVSTMQEELAKHEARIQELEQKLVQTAAEARPEVEKRIAELKARVAAARDTLQRLSAASDDAWKELMKGVDAAMTELRKAFEEPGATQPASAPASAGSPSRP